MQPARVHTAAAGGLASSTAMSLLECCNCNYLDGVLEAITAGESVNVVDDSGSCALHYVAGLPDLSICEELLQRGCNPNTLAENGNAPLADAAFYRNAPFMRLLMAAGALVDNRNKDGGTALHISCVVMSVECVSDLCKAGADKSQICQYEGKSQTAVQITEGKLAAATAQGNYDEQARNYEILVIFRDCNTSPIESPMLSDPDYIHLQSAMSAKT